MIFRGYADGSEQSLWQTRRVKARYRYWRSGIRQIKPKTAAIDRQQYDEPAARHQRHGGSSALYMSEILLLIEEMPRPHSGSPDAAAQGYRAASALHIRSGTDRATAVPV